MQLLLDENLSPRVAGWAQAAGWPARCVAHIGLQGASDEAVWEEAWRRDEVVVTINASDFLVLARGVEVHPGLIVLRQSGLSREEQWVHLAAGLRWLGEAGFDDRLNRVLVVNDPDSHVVLEIPG